MLIEGLAQVSARQVARTDEAIRFVPVVLLEKARFPGLRGEVGRYVLAHQQCFEVVGQQQPLGTRAPFVVVHDAALKALVDEVRVVRVTRWLAGRGPPNLEVHQRQQG